jgi:hypothetical protein
MFFAIVDQETGRACGIASYLRIDPEQGACEVGHLAFSPLLQRSARGDRIHVPDDAQCVFELGYRRYEWKCNALNAPSCQAALRLGFRFEGIFRQATVSKGRNRDTAWYSSSTGSGLRCATPTSAGSRPATSMRTGASARPSPT